MYTQCPECLKIYEIDREALRTAAGRARCGSCGVEFDATERLADQLGDPVFEDESAAEDKPQAFSRTPGATIRRGAAPPSTATQSAHSESDSGGETNQHSADAASKAKSGPQAPDASSDITAESNDTPSPASPTPPGSTDSNTTEVPAAERQQSFNWMDFDPALTEDDAPIFPEEDDHSAPLKQDHRPPADPHQAKPTGRGVPVKERAAQSPQAHPVAASAAEPSAEREQPAIQTSAGITPEPEQESTPRQREYQPDLIGPDQGELDYSEGDNVGNGDDGLPWERRGMTPGQRRLGLALLVAAILLAGLLATAWAFRSEPAAQQARIPNAGENAWQLIDTDVRQHPRLEDVILLDVSFRNVTESALVYPAVRLTLVNRNRDRIAERVILPDTYMLNFAPDKALAPDSVLRASLALERPRREWAAYEVALVAPTLL